jgi:hypothetical protein
VIQYTVNMIQVIMPPNKPVYDNIVNMSIYFYKQDFLLPLPQSSLLQFPQLRGPLLLLPISILLL